MNQQNQPPLETAWQTLRANLEWSLGFGLIFVFCSDVRAKEALFRRADDLMRTQVRPFQRLPVRQASDLKNHLLPAAVSPSAAQVKMGMPLWLDLDGHPADPQWDSARDEFLYRLNERRASLTREHTRAVVLALPLDWTKRAAEAAPDLWTIRQPSVYLETSGRTVQPPLANPSATDVVTADNAHPTEYPAITAKTLPLAVRRWQDSIKSGIALTVWDSAEASEAALQAGHTAVAIDIAREAVAQVRQAIAAQGNTPERLRDLSISMNKLGDVALALRRLDEAQTAYAEGERLRRELIAEFGKTPERLRDLSVSMNKLGDVALALGRLDEAQKAYARGEQLSRELITEFDKTPERLRDLSVSSEKLGEVAQALGRLDEAQTAYAESERLRRELGTQFGNTPERLRDLSVSMKKLGNVAQALGRLNEAQTAYAEGERLSRELIDKFGKTPQRLRDLSVSMVKLGNVAQALGQLDEAKIAYVEGERLRRELITEFGKTPERLRDLSVSLNRLGNIAQALGRPDEAKNAYAESERLSRELTAEFGKTPDRLRDLSVSMNRLGNIAQALGRLDEAQTAYAEQISIARELLDAYGDSVPALEVMASGEHGLGEVMQQGGAGFAAQQHLRSALDIYQRLSAAMPHRSDYAENAQWIEATLQTIGLACAKG